jgi:hypothetical protein
VAPNLAQSTRKRGPVFVGNYYVGGYIKRPNQAPLTHCKNIAVQIVNPNELSRSSLGARYVHLDWCPPYLTYSELFALTM